MPHPKPLPKENFMLSIEEIRKHKAAGEYIAVCISGKRYHASFVNKYAPDGVMFFCIPDREIVIGYEKL